MYGDDSTLDAHLEYNRALDNHMEAREREYDDSILERSAIARAKAARIALARVAMAMNQEAA
jgi:hypothetical protein